MNNMTAPVSVDEWQSVWDRAQELLEARTEFVVTLGATPVPVTSLAEFIQLRAAVFDTFRMFGPAGAVLNAKTYDAVRRHYRDTVAKCIQRQTMRVYGTEVSELATARQTTASTHRTATLEQDELDAVMVRRVVLTVRDLDAVYVRMSCRVFAHLDEHYTKSCLSLRLSMHAASLEAVAAFPVATVRDAIIDGIGRSRANPLSTAEVMRRLLGRHWAVAVGLYGPPTMRELYSVTDVFRIVLAFVC